MMTHKDKLVIALAGAVIALLSGGLAWAQDDQAPDAKPDTWTFFDYTEERGWSNTNKAGNNISVMDCVYDAKKNRAAFWFTGYTEKYLEKMHWITAELGEDADNVGYVFSSPGEYFPYEQVFIATIPKNLAKADLKICARPADDQNREECEVFAANGFRAMFDDLCVEAE